MLPDAFWVVLAVAILALTVVACALLLAGTYLLFQLARERRMEADAQFSVPQPTPEQDREDKEADLSEEEEEARLFALLDSSRNQNAVVKADWIAEKQAEGWSDADIEEFLAKRPLLELN